MIWAGRDVTDHLVPVPCLGPGHFPLEQVVQTPFNLDLDISWDGETTAS